MYWWIPMAVSAVSTYISSSSASASNDVQESWNNYNAVQQYNTDQRNLKSQAAITQANIAMTMASAQSTNAINDVSVDYNVKEIESVQRYNDLMYEKEIDDVATARDLDLELVHRERAQERGTIEAQQSASGTVMGEGSNADTIKAQMTNEALEAFIVKYGADKEINSLNNARAQSAWEAQKAVDKLKFEGQLSNISTMNNALMQGMGMAVSGALGQDSGSITASSALTSNLAAADLTATQNDTAITTGAISGTVQAIGQGASNYYQSRVPTTTLPTSTGTSGTSVVSDKASTAGTALTQEG